jgi:hypothetical protein
MLQASRSLALLATLLLAACESSADEGADSGELSHADDIQPIWDDNCVDNCHTAGGLAAFLDLNDGHATLVDQPATQVTGASRVASGSSADSYLVAKLRGTHIDFGGNGNRMPSGNNPPLDEATISMIEAWIDAGAPE